MIFLLSTPVADRMMSCRCEHLIPVQAPFAGRELITRVPTIELLAHADPDYSSGNTVERSILHPGKMLTGMIPEE